MYKTIADVNTERGLKLNIWYDKEAMKAEFRISTNSGFMHAVLTKEELETFIEQTIYNWSE